MLLENFRPQSKLVTKNTLVDKPKFPAIDAHDHLRDPFGGGWDKKPLGQLLDLLDEAGITHYVDLDGGWGEDILYAHLNYFKEKAPERFQIFGGVDWSKWESMGDAFPEWAVGRLKVQKEAGAQGLKIWKPFGLQVKDHHGQLVKVDDARLAPIWDAAGELGLPVLIHVADPVAFFDPIDETNERWEELGEHPDWAFTSPPFPPFTRETAAAKARAAEDAWNSRDPERVSLAYTVDSAWRNRAEIFSGRPAIVEFLKRKWARELDYRLIKEVWTFRDNRIAVRFAYEWHDDSGHWFRSYGNENWEFDEHGLMRLRYASINDLPVSEADRKYRWPLGRRPDGHPGLSELGL